MEAFKQEQATWGGRFSSGPSELMLQFGESISFDSKLAVFDIACNRAQAKMLAHTGILTAEECTAILAGLDGIEEELRAGTLKFSLSLEDIHMNIEQALTKRVPAAAKIHTGRSRNDQVATDMRLFFKHAAVSVAKSLDAVADALLDFAEKNQKVYIPGYTHLQRAQPVSVAHHLLAYVEMFMRDRGRFETVADHANWSPLGSGAIAGTTLPIDRDFAARAMGFVDAGGNARLTRNSMDAVSDRDTYLEFAAASAICGLHLSRLAEDFILWNTSEFGFIVLPDAFTTGSSLMPQKKNPDSMELIRGKSARLQGNLLALLTMVKGLPLTYNRDLQEDKPPVFDSFEQLSLCLEVVAQVLAGSQMREDRCAAAVADPLLLATDVADYLVRAGVPFREAHHAVGHLVAKAEALGVPLDKLPLEEAQAIHPKLAADWVKTFDLETAMRSREKPGMPGPEQVASQIAFWKNRKR
ncbi:MAG: argininosuccinate lyase [Opitutales bacterium]|nr:argininosuccinate lyase [Opitutales bacterium]